MMFTKISFGVFSPVPLAMTCNAVDSRKILEDNSLVITSFLF